jgi:uncharacterized protein (TIGR03437 family)
VGDGAPNSSVRQAIEEALTRNSISPHLPTDNAVRRAGAGYVQQFTALSPASLGRFLVVKADSSVQAFVVSAGRLARYEQLGGVAGVLGFATSDANAAGRQLFENNYALAGSPPVLVAAPVTQKWAALGYETGAAGLPSADAASIGFSAFGSAGVAQTFAGAVIYGFTAGQRGAQAYFVSGLILARYNQLNGPAGILGLPISDAFPTGSGRTEQNFEGGFVDFAPGDSAAVEHPASRTPTVSVFPSQTAVGSRVHISISGFATGHMLAVSITSQPDFQVTPPGGAFGWDVQLRPGVASGSYHVTVRDTAGSDRADGAYSVRAAAQTRYQLTKVSGDNQSALPASQVAQPLVVRLTDDGGNPIAGASVSFSSIAGASVTPAQAVTDANGYAQATLRLPPDDGLALANAEAGGQVVTFAAHAQDSNLSTFPTFRQSMDNVNVGSGPATIHEKGALLTALAALFRYYQDLGELPSPNGPADPPTLNQFLLADGYLSFTLDGDAVLVVNPVRALDFVSAAADFELLPAVDLGAIRDSVNAGRPVLLGLMLHADGVDRGGHYVVATGVGPDGSILVYDPSPDWNRASLRDYLNGFPALGRTWTATILHGLRLNLQARSSRGFLSYAPGSAQLHIAANGGGGYQIRIPALAAFDRLAMDNGDTADLSYRDGMATAYQLSTAAAGVTVRGPTTAGPLGAGVFRVNPDPASFSVTPQAVTATADGMRNAASFGSRLAPGSLASLFGAGLADALVIPVGRSLSTNLGGLSITVGGFPAPLLFASPFQANLQLPFELPPGPQTVQVTSKYGTTSFDISLDAAAPGIFLVGPSSAAVLNQDGTLNAAVNPAARGSVLQVFATGLGAVAPSVSTVAPAPPSPLSFVVATVTATIDDQPAPVPFAGLAPGFVGLDQVNVLIPPALPPDPNAQLVIHAGLDSNTVGVAVQ